MKNRIGMGILCLLLFFSLVYMYARPKEIENQDPSNTEERYRGFLLDQVYVSQEDEIHYNIYIPDTYDGKQAVPLYISLPGYQGLYFQGVGENLRTEDFVFEARDRMPEMIIVAPQLEDWQETSARQTIALTEYLMETYLIDRLRVYASGYSGGAETMSLVMGRRPDLFTAYLHCSAQWDGDLERLADSQTPVYMVIGLQDEYYGSDVLREAYDKLYEIYENRGFSEEEINKILILDIKENSYFESQGAENQHGQGGALFARDEKVMGWLFQQRRM